jgi:hypothetical protein
VLVNGMPLYEVSLAAGERPLDAARGRLVSVATKGSDVGPSARRTQNRTRGHPARQVRDRVDWRPGTTGDLAGFEPKSQLLRRIYVEAGDNSRRWQ